jgi:LL-diaminopimelate aminotransferase
VPKPQASLYIWSKVPGGLPSMAFCQRILQKAHVVITPGVGFGQAGEGYFRMSLTVPTERIQEAIARMRRAL